MKAYLYSRVSSTQQLGGFGIDRQDELGLEYYNRVIAPTGIPLDDTVRCDKGKSAFKGTHLAKDGALRKILDEIAAGTITPGSILICENLDRISRQGPKLARQTLAAVTDHDVEIHVLNITNVLKRNWENEFGQSVVVDNELQRAWKASVDKSTRIQRTKDERKTQAKDGWILSKTVPCWLEVVGRQTSGNRIIEAGKIVTIPSEVAIVQEAFRLAGLGLGVKHIMTNIFTKFGCKRSLSWYTRLLADRSVLGEFTPRGRDPILNYYPPVIDQSVFDAARAQAAKKYKGNHVISGKVNSEAKCLFSNLMYDETDEPARKMYPEFTNRGRYVVSAFQPDRKQNRMRYDRLEAAVLSFLTQADWSAIASASDSDEVTARKAELTTVKNEIGKIERQIARNTAAMDSTEDLAELKVYGSRASKFEAALQTLAERRDMLATAVDSAIDQLKPLYEPATLLRLIRESSPEAIDIRLKLRSETAKRVSKISVQFNENRAFDEEGEPWGKKHPNVWIFIEYVNGIRHFAEIWEDGTVQAVHNGGKGVRNAIEAVKRGIERKREKLLLNPLKCHYFKTLSRRVEVFTDGEQGLSSEMLS